MVKCLMKLDSNIFAAILIYTVRLQVCIYICLICGSLVNYVGYLFYIKRFVRLDSLLKI